MNYLTDRKEEPIQPEYAESPRTIGEGKKVAFLINNKTYLEERIRDLEKTISIHKDIIGEIMGSKGKEQESYKTIIEKMNNESKLNHELLKNAIKQRDEYQAKLLISEQIAANFQRQEKEQLAEYQEKIKDLVDQLDRKEFVLQDIQFNYSLAIIMLKKLAERDSEALVLVNELNLDDFEKNEMKISNVIEENKNLRAEFKEMSQRAELLERELQYFVKRYALNSDSIQEMKTAVSTERNLVKNLKEKTLYFRHCGPTGSHIGENFKSSEINTYLFHRISELEEENHSLLQKVSNMTTPPEIQFASEVFPNDIGKLSVIMPTREMRGCKEKKFIPEIEVQNDLLENNQFLGIFFHTR